MIKKSGPVLELLPPRGEYARLMHRWMRQPSSIRYSSMKRLGVEKIKKRIMQEKQDLRRRLKLPSCRWFVRAGEDIVGTVSLHNVKRGDKVAEVGAMMGEEFQGRGLGARAVEMLVDKVFAETDIRKLMAYVNERNRASRRLAESLGFKKEGLLRRQLLVNGRPANEVVYGLLRSERKKRG
ncbi:MAG: GNAT family protein [Elusimicrobiales bacterium]|nr:GNAT family protein [Elusimicrobiales bacterium]